MFQTKSKRGIATPRLGTEVIKRRLAEAERLLTKSRTDMRIRTSNRIKMEKSSGYIFSAVGFPHPERELLKAKLTLEIYRLIRKRNLTQAEAGKILGIKQPHVLALMRNRAGSFSLERLMIPDCPWTGCRD